MQALFGAGLGDEDGREIRDSVRGDGFQKEASREPWEVSEQWMDTPEPFQRSVPPDHKRSRRREILPVGVSGVESKVALSHLPPSPFIPLMHWPQVSRRWCLETSFEAQKPRPFEWLPCHWSVARGVGVWFHLSAPSSLRRTS